MDDDIEARVDALELQIKHFLWEWRYVFYYIISLFMFIAPLYFLSWFKEKHGKAFLAYQKKGCVGEGAEPKENTKQVEAKTSKKEEEPKKKK
eukprot:1195737-Prorocentrum_minimum.AAC.6